MNKITSLTENEFLDILRFVADVKAFLEHRDHMNGYIHELPVRMSPLTNTARVVFAILDANRPK